MSIRGRGFFSRMRRYPADGWIGGVCAGLAVHFDWNAKLLRVLFVVGLLFSGFFPVGLAYCLLWYLMDEAHGQGAEPEARSNHTASRETPASTMTDVKARFARLEERLRHMEASVTSSDYELRRELRKLES